MIQMRDGEGKVVAMFEDVTAFRKCMSLILDEEAGTPEHEYGRRLYAKAKRDAQ